MNFIKSMTVAQKLFAIIAIAVTVATVQAGIGLFELSKSRDSLKTVYEDRMVPLEQLDSIAINMLKNRTHINAALNETHTVIGPDKKPILALDTQNALKEAQYIERKIEEISKTWAVYMATNLTPEEKLLAEKFSDSRGEFVTKILKPAIVKLQSGNYQELAQINAKTQDLFMLAEKDLLALKTLQLDIAAKEYQSAASSFENIRLLTFAGLAFAVILMMVVGYAISRSITKALGGEPGAMYDAANRIAAGNLDFKINLAANDSTSAMAAMSNMQSNIKQLVADASMLSTAAKEGRLATRADANRHLGDYRKVVAGVNETLDAVIGPLNVAANYVDRISKGDIPAKITDNYNGDFNAIKQNLNTCIDAVNNMVTEAVSLEKSAIDGQLNTRADANKYQGDFRKVIEGFNKSLDAIVTPLTMAAGYVEKLAKGDMPAKITDSYNGDFNVIKNNLNTCIDAISLLVFDANKLAQAAQDNKLDERADAKKHFGDYRKVIEGVNGTLDTVMAKNASDAAQKAKEAQALQSAVEETQEVIESAKTGDLSNRVSLAGKAGAIASLCDGVNALMDKMTEVVVQVREAGETINTAAGEISSGNTDLSSRTEQQASSLEETAASMEELASTVKNNAENAKQANQLAASASSVAIKGGEVVGQVVATMSSINESAKKIEDIISVIDGIAFQTNILALNAAVEAARAGEQGRGFAVVAGEVRNLAQRSASAAKEIKELITDSVSKTAEGTVQVEDAGKTMQEIVSSVQRVTDIMGEITAASIEQSAGIDQVNSAITSMDEVTQQNAALVEEAAAAAESLVEQAVTLMDTVNEFKLNGGNQVTNNRRASNSPMRRPNATVSKAAGLAKPETKFSFSDATQAHIKWKNRLVNYVSGNSDEHLEVEKVCRDDQCPLGGWIHGEARKHAHLREYKELKTAHAEFHQSVGDIVQHVHDNKQAEARKLLGADFSRTSKRTIAAIQEIESVVNANSANHLKTVRKNGTDDGEWEAF
ncbi:MAG TPA: methyl-accepting chemotaxis protein [Methylotenera sp.]|nr:methyl-accepting chemotaxis protein [Methylotenera sp.]